LYKPGQSKPLSLNINESDNAPDLNLAPDVAAYFRQNKKRALEIVEAQ